MSTPYESGDRVRQATPSSINEQIESETWQRVESYAQKNEPDLSARINELEKEWDIERYLGVNMSTLAFTGLAIAALTKNKNWNILPAVVLGFFFQHSVQGWCPPLPILRKMKIRTRKEIEEERYALKFMRGDFDRLLSAETGNTQALRSAIKKD